MWRRAAACCAAVEQRQQQNCCCCPQRCSAEGEGSPRGWASPTAVCKQLLEQMVFGQADAASTRRCSSSNVRPRDRMNSRACVLERQNDERCCHVSWGFALAPVNAFAVSVMRRQQLNRRVSVCLVLICNMNTAVVTGSAVTAAKTQRIIFACFLRARRFLSNCTCLVISSDPAYITLTLERNNDFTCAHRFGGRSLRLH